MPFRIPALFFTLCSLAAGVLGLFLPARFILPGYGPSYAALSVDAAYPDRYIGELLSRPAGRSREGALENYISESTQWVFLDDFGELRRVPLDEYGARVEVFDPRNDGYAGRLRDFFVREGERRFFIPLPEGISGAGFKGLEAAAAAALGDIPFSLTPLGREISPLPWYALLFAAAALTALILSSGSPGMAGLIPLMAAAIPAGPPGFAFCGVFAALAGLLRKPLGEFFTARRYGVFRGSGFPAGRGGEGRAEGRRPVFSRFSLGAALGLVLCGGGIFAAGGLPPVLGIFLPAGFCLLFPAGCWVESTRGRRENHVRFTPLPILDRPAPGFPLLRSALPFALASALALFPLPYLSGFFPAPSPGSGIPAEEEFLVYAGEYERHAAFQSLFSFLSLDGAEGFSVPADPPGPGPGGINQSGYLRYYLGDDGLIAGTMGLSFDLPRGEIPPFPLEDLMGFLSGEERGAGLPAPGEGAFPPLREMVPVYLIMLALLPSLLPAVKGRLKKTEMPVINYKRIAA